MDLNITYNNWISLQRQLREKEYCALPVYFRMPAKEWETEWNRYIWQAEEDYRRRIDDIWSGKYRGESEETNQDNEAADDTILEPEKLAESSASTEARRNDSIVELPKLDLPDTSSPLDDQSNEEFPSLTSTATSAKDKLESPHPKSLYRTPNPILLVSPPPPAGTTITKVGSSTRQAKRHLQPASSINTHSASDDLAGPRTIVLKKHPAADAPRTAKQQIKEKPTSVAAAHDDASEKQEKAKQPAKEHISPPRPISKVKKQKKPTTESVATSAPVVAPGPISGRKRKVKTFKSSQQPPAPQTPQASIPATASGATSAAISTGPAPASEAESREAAVDVSSATKPSKEREVGAGRNVAGDGSGEMMVRFGAVLLLLILAFSLRYALGL